MDAARPAMRHLTGMRKPAAAQETMSPARGAAVDMLKPPAAVQRMVRAARRMPPLPVLRKTAQPGRVYPSPVHAMPALRSDPPDAGGQQAGPAASVPTTASGASRIAAGAAAPAYLVHRAEGIGAETHRRFSRMASPRGVPSAGNGPQPPAHVPAQRRVSDLRLDVAQRTGVREKPVQEALVQSLHSAVKSVEEELEKTKEMLAKPKIDMNRLTDQLYRELSKRIRLEAQRRGL